MPRDHHIARTYLKYFVDPLSPPLLNVWRKGDLKQFKARTDDVCFAEGWDTNPYFREPRIVDQYLRIVEPRWNSGASDIQNILGYEETKYWMAGYIAVMASCSPTAIRNSTASIEQMIKLEAERLMHEIQRDPAAFAEIEPLPQNLFAQLIEGGGVKACVDPKYSHAQMVLNIMNLQWLIFLSPWRILEAQGQQVFLTSDFPVGFFYPDRQSGEVFRFVPITPRYCILIKLSTNSADRLHPKEELTQYPETVVDIVVARDRFVRELNVITVKSAESLVISSLNEIWITRLVQKYNCWKLYGNTAHSVDK